ncbi:MAG: hypothetical protein JF606_17485 [Burkholderiales bacterium]|jgi:hypothetical protein|nr:hypothetical protein [Burkholderiales bacterium]
MSWTAASDLRSQLLRLWDKGRLLSCMVAATDVFPLRLTLKVPSSSDLSDRFDEVRAWSRALQQGAKNEKGRGYRLVLREVRHRVIGSNVLPNETWIDTLDDALHLLGKQREAQVFGRLVDRTRAEHSALLTCLNANPLRALAIACDWPRLLEVVSWMQAHPRPGIYLRQVDLPGIHTKFIEEHRAVLSEMLDHVLPADAIDPSASGVSGFVQRYGFRNKPMRVRFRMLDARQAMLGSGDQDITVTDECFATLNVAVSRVFMTENEINFLAFPAVSNAMVIFGAGYGFDMLSQARWLQEKSIHYWGDIDTHGFAILDQLRARFAHVESFLMDRQTLMDLRPQWSHEAEPTLRDLSRLTLEERSLFDDLRWKRLEDMQIRLEQERIGFKRVEGALNSLM